jgi:hypothetical protein
MNATLVAIGAVLFWVLFIGILLLLLGLRWLWVIVFGGEI